MTTISLMAGHSTVMICCSRFAPSIMAASFRSLLALEREAVYMMEDQPAPLPDAADDVDGAEGLGGWS